MWVKRPLPLRRRAHFWVVVPCYKYGHYLQESVDSIVNQPEVTSTVASSMTRLPTTAFRSPSNWERHLNVQALRNEQNSGHIATYNRGLTDADSDY